MNTSPHREIHSIYNSCHIILVISCHIHKDTSKFRSNKQQQMKQNHKIKNWKSENTMVKGLANVISGTPNTLKAKIQSKSNKRNWRKNVFARAELTVNLHIWCATTTLLRMNIHIQSARINYLNCTCSSVSVLYRKPNSNKICTSNERLFCEHICLYNTPTNTRRRLQVASDLRAHMFQILFFSPCHRRWW